MGQRFDTDELSVFDSMHSSGQRGEKMVTTAYAHPNEEFGLIVEQVSRDTGNVLGQYELSENGEMVVEYNGYLEPDVLEIVGKLGYTLWS